MQDKYVGDVGDFGKYGLLRALRREGLPGNGPASLGVAWWLVPDDDKKPDGRFTGYLGKPERYEHCDKELFDKLSILVNERRRTVAQVKAAGVLKGARFFEGRLDFSQLSAAGPSGRQARLDERERWVDKALEKTKGCDIVFLDPDNGIETPSTERHHKKGPKFVFYDEIERFATRVRVTVVYHHLCRHRQHGDHAKQIANRMSSLAELVPGSKVFGLRFNRYNARAYFLIVRKQRDSDSICSFLHGFVGGEWGCSFDSKVHGSIGRPKG